MHSHLSLVSQPRAVMKHYKSVCHGSAGPAAFSQQQGKSLVPQQRAAGASCVLMDPKLCPRSMLFQDKQCSPSISTLSGRDWHQPGAPRNGTSQEGTTFWPWLKAAPLKSASDIHCWLYYTGIKGRIIKSFKQSVLLPKKAWSISEQ